MIIKIEKEDLEKSVNKLPNKSMRIIKLIALLVCLLSYGNIVNGQTQVGGGIDYRTPNTYTIAGIVVVGADYTDAQAIKAVSGLQVGQEIDIPSDKTSQAIRNLWKQRLFSQIEIDIAEVREKDVYLVIKVMEMPRLARYNWRGIRKTEAESLRESINLYTGINITEEIKNRTINIVEDYFIDKGFLNVSANITEKIDTLMTNSKMLTIHVKKGKKVKIKEIVFTGVDQVKEGKLRRALKETKEKKWWRLWKVSKYIEDEFVEGKGNILAKYNEDGFRNARIISDSTVKVSEKLIKLYVHVSEDKKFYFRKVSFTGNQKYATSRMDSILNIDKGEVYDLSKMEARLYQNPKGQDITSLYQDQGYLNFYAYPIETLVEPDSIDIEIRMSEGKEFRYGQISVIGNTKTNDHVIYREVRTLPGEIFSRNDIIRTQRELSQLGYFDPQQFAINPTQNPQEGTVDIEYGVAEKPSDQIELSGGFGGGRVVGSLGLTFTNFSMRNILKKDAWRPLPSGDGQKLSLRGYTNGFSYNSINLSFVEPWLGGKKPTSLSVSLFRTVQATGRKWEKEDFDGDTHRVINTNRGTFKILGTSVGVGKRFKRPDDWFLGYIGVSFQYYELDKFQRIFSFSQGHANNLALTGTIQRNSISDPIFPTWGSDIKFTAKATLPYSAFDGVDDYSGFSEQEKVDWVEYYKLKFTAKWHTTLFSHKMGEEGKLHNLVLATGAGIGYLGSYNKQLGLSPFERFYLGGLPLSGYTYEAREVISLRGYPDYSLTPSNSAGNQVGAPVIAKYNMELRYPLSTNPNAYIYTLAFLEAGQVWGNAKDFSPFDLKRSGGVGLRIFLPMFGLLGLDYGWPLDAINGFEEKGKGEFHFSIGMNLGEL